jgi:hypothetical protein
MLELKESGQTCPINPVVIFKKSGRIYFRPPARRAYASERYSGSTYNHLSESGRTCEEE